MKLYVGNLPYSTTEADLRDLFSSHGSLDDVHIPLDRETGQARGFAFVTLSTREAGESAMKELDGTDFGGRNLRINEAEERRGGGGGGYRGGGGGGGGGGGRDRRGGGRDHRDRRGGGNRY